MMVEKKKKNKQSINFIMVSVFPSSIQCRSTLVTLSVQKFDSIQRAFIVYALLSDGESENIQFQSERYAFSVFADNVLLMICGY